MAEKETIVIESFFTEENLEETIKGVWEKLYEHYCTTAFDLTKCSLTSYLNMVRTYYNFLKSKKLVLHHIKSLYSHCLSEYTAVIATDIFGAIYFLAKIDLVERNDIAQGICRCCNCCDVYNIYEGTPLEAWKKNYDKYAGELTFIQLVESMQTSNTSASPSDEESPTLQNNEQITHQPTPHDIFAGFTDNATEEDLTTLQEKCQLNDGAAKAAVICLKEYSEKQVVDIHGWTKKRLFNDLTQLGLSCKINNFYKAFTAKEEHMLKKKPAVL
jgi:hypothetical protein